MVTHTATRTNTHTRMDTLTATLTVTRTNTPMHIPIIHTHTVTSTVATRPVTATEGNLELTKNRWLRHPFTSPFSCPLDGSIPLNLNAPAPSQT
jgi:hypothetical protein